MLHRWKMYVNTSERRIPRLIDSGQIELPCENPDTESYRQTFDPEPLWQFLQNESDLSEVGQYVLLTSIERPTFDGKRWFIRTAFNSTGASMRQEETREVSWVNIKKLQFWNSSLRTYTQINQTRGIMDYTLYVSRCFGYCFLVGISYDDEDGDSQEFTNFYPSIHHYHAQVAINEAEIYLPFASDLDWHPKTYGVSLEVEHITVDEAAAIAGAVEGVVETMNTWTSSVEGVMEGVDLGDFLEEDSEED